MHNDDNERKAMSTPHGDFSQHSLDLSRRILDDRLSDIGEDHYKLIGYGFYGSPIFNTDTPDSDYDMLILISTDYNPKRFSRSFSYGEYEGQIMSILNYRGLSAIEKYIISSGKFHYDWSDPWSYYADSIRDPFYNTQTMYRRSIKYQIDLAKDMEKKGKFDIAFNKLRAGLKAYFNYENASKYATSGRIYQYDSYLSDEDRERYFKSLQDMRSEYERSGISAAIDYLKNISSEIR